MNIRIAVLVALATAVFPSLSLPRPARKRNRRSSSASVWPSAACARSDLPVGKGGRADPTYPAAFNDLAIGYEHEGQFDKARKA
jgi:hypothetical protein